MGNYYGNSGRYFIPKDKFNEFIDGLVGDYVNLGRKLDGVDSISSWSNGELKVILENKEIVFNSKNMSVFWSTLNSSKSTKRRKSNPFFKKMMMSIRTINFRGNTGGFYKEYVKNQIEYHELQGVFGKFVRTGKRCDGQCYSREALLLESMSNDSPPSLVAIVHPNEQLSNKEFLCKLIVEGQVREGVLNYTNDVYTKDNFRPDFVFNVIEDSVPITYAKGWINNHGTSDWISYREEEAIKHKEYLDQGKLLEIKSIFGVRHHDIMYSHINSLAKSMNFFKQMGDGIIGNIDYNW